MNPKLCSHRANQTANTGNVNFALLFAYFAPNGAIERFVTHLLAIPFPHSHSIGLSGPKASFTQSDCNCESDIHKKWVPRKSNVAFTQTDSNYQNRFRFRNLSLWMDPNFSHCSIQRQLNHILWFRGIDGFVLDPTHSNSLQTLARQNVQLIPVTSYGISCY